MAKIDLVANECADLVFQNRNKDYGAYVLRKGTSSRNVKSMLIVLILGLLAVAGIKLINFINEQSEVANTQAVELSAIEEAKKKAKKVEKVEQPKVEPEKIEVEKVKSSIKFTAPVIKKDDEVRPEDEMKSQDEIMNSKVAVGFANVIGNDESGEVLKAKEMIVNEPVKPKEEENKVFDVVEQMPSFPGGMAALMAYLQKSIKYPPVAEENGIQGRVVCTFVVERDGSVTDVRVAKSVDPSLDKEAVRVVSAMPRWIPGKQNGQSVRVKYTLPVTFRLQ